MYFAVFLTLSVFFALFQPWLFSAALPGMGSAFPACAGLPGEAAHGKRPSLPGRLFEKPAHVQELTAEIIREFVERIFVHKAERINGNRVQRIRIVWNCIGEFTPLMHEGDEKTA
ncbi:MAG: DUF4368 domain-containing protein [Clostridia bacterium]|nr:DUF4368 domain-containing protein [Clostridia bacterium]